MTRATHDERLHDAACEQVAIEGEPQSVIRWHAVRHGLAQGEEDTCGYKHAQ